MLQPLKFVRNNLPSTKPELWRNAPLALRRRLLAWISSTVDPRWAWRPCLVTVEPEGLLMEVLPDETMSRSILYYGVYEYAPSELVRAYLAPGDTFVDVGANMGYYSLLAAARVGGSGRVLAFEPSARVRARLERSVSLNGFTHVAVRSEAVGEVNGHVTLVEPGSDNHGLAFVQKEGGVDVGARVRSVTLDDVLGAGKPTPALIKVDVEGGESEVFRGASRLLASPEGPAILFESFKLAHDRVLLERHGYEVLAPSLERGRFCLRPLSTSPDAYRTWEAPNYFAAKGERGRAFIARHRTASR
jgi:FkbM family methyltransferase